MSFESSRVTSPSPGDLTPSAPSSEHLHFLKYSEAHGLTAEESTSDKKRDTNWSYRSPAALTSAGHSDLRRPRTPSKSE